MKQQPLTQRLRAAARRTGRWVWVLAGILVFKYVHAWQADEELAEVRSQSALRAAALTVELDRLASLPEIMSLDGRLSQALDSPGDRVSLDIANAFLQQAQQRTGAEAVFLIDLQGRTIAASNFAQAQSFVGQNYAYRPYFKDALKGQPGRFYAVGTTTGRPGYFLAAAVREGVDVRGVVAVKISLDSFGKTLKTSRGVALVADKAGVIILASHSEFKYRTLAPLSAVQRAYINDTRQYNDLALEALAPGADLRDGARILNPGRNALLKQNPLVVSRRVEPSGWSVVGFTGTPNARKTAMLAAAATALSGLGGALVWQIVMLRAQRRRELLQAEEQIRQRIDAGTLELREQLQEQARTELVLRATTDEAVQAGKLAVLGQMAGAVSHELNQPLTAIRNFSANALVYLAQGRLDEANQNVVRIGGLADRMGQVVSHLTTHLRKQHGALEAVDLERAIHGTLQLLATLHDEAPGVVVYIQPLGLKVLAHPVRLEQVLLNLLRNALQAQPSQRPPCVNVVAEGSRVLIEILDFGPGIDADAMDHLFEPFFTTKPQGHGLGLGLAVSVMIMRAMGGELVARNAPSGGAVFSIRLARAEEITTGNEAVYGS
jgi:two-component system, NtrC family, C4-dicarboxylate transport sensor histidine kinase DctB